MRVRSNPRLPARASPAAHHVSFRVPAARRTCGAIPATVLEQRVPVPEDEEELEFDVYGRYKFEHEPAGVDALGRAWVPVEVIAAAENWEDEEAAFVERVSVLSAPFK